jgi:hypothetical protein
MFAVKRTASVPGRNRLLIVSIITMNGISMVGVPWGTKCSGIWLVFLIHPNNINLIHIGRAYTHTHTHSIQFFVQFFFHS